MLINNDWDVYFSDIFSQPNCENIMKLYEQEVANNNIVYPPEGQIFTAFKLSSFEDTKVVIIGQDPYHNPGQAHGLSFSVPDGVKIPPSLRNIYKEMAIDLDKPIPEHGNLSSWAEQGVLLLNSVLTVEKNNPGSHSMLGWEGFTNNIIGILSEKKKNLVFLLWGAYAHKKAEFIDETKHLILTAPHPSPFSAYKGFFGCQHFSKTNDYLVQHTKKTILW